ncbi:MAG: hypothetical protein RL653_4009 [Pseudomonadota bacterium]|jgi:hypothetical protein
MIRIATAAFAALALTGCGNICDRYANYNDTMQTKLAGCKDLAALFPKTTFSVSTCNENLSECSSEDIRKMNESLDCFEKVSACTDATMEAWGSDVEACAKKSETVTTACSAAISKAMN